MKWILSLSLLISSSQAFAVEGALGRFLKSCAWGMAIGTAVGTVTLAFEEKPSEHTINIARGASLGLYGGIAYGMLQMNPPEPANRSQFDQDIGWIAPSVKDGSVVGVNANFVLHPF